MQIDDGLVIQPEDQASTPYFEERRHREFMIKMYPQEGNKIITELYKDGAKTSLELPSVLLYKEQSCKESVLHKRTKIVQNNFHNLKQLNVMIIIPVPDMHLISNVNDAARVVKFECEQEFEEGRINTPSGSYIFKH